MKTLAERVMGKLSIDRDTGCWNYTGKIGVQGYGEVANEEGKYRKAHRIIYTLMHGAIPKGMVLHHRCENRRCCNPAHLQLTTQGIHMRDLTPTHPAYQNARLTHCKRGHPLVAGNLEPWALKHGGRKCSVCSREHERRYRNRSPKRFREMRAEYMRAYRARKAAKQV